MVKRAAYLEQLKRVLPASLAWDQWLAASSELPPDFDALPSRSLLPNPLLRDDRQITTPADWAGCRLDLREQIIHWVMGSAPPAPDCLDAQVLDERQEVGARTRDLVLRFGNGAFVHVQLLIPDGPGPFPVFLTQHNHRGWALIALQRGYLGCIYAGSDDADDTDSFLSAYPGFEWSRLTRRAWAASRCIDYLATVPEAGSQIAITGHSRNGKQSLMAAALDDRISLVISSSSGAGGSVSFRYFAEPHGGESIEMLTRAFPEWFPPRLRFFAGREQKLPVDMPDLVAMAAPRPCLLSTALNDGVESAWAIEQTYRAIMPVWQLHGAEDGLAILWRPGSHETCAEDIERYVDWCDLHFRGRPLPPAAASNFVLSSAAISQATPTPRTPTPTNPGMGAVSVQARLTDDAGGPVQANAQAGDWHAWRADVRQRVRRALGAGPPAAFESGRAYGAEAGHVAQLLGRPAPGDGLEKLQVSFGAYLAGDVYLSAGLSSSGKKAPGILYVHPFSYAGGYVMPYRRGDQIYRTLARAGYVVFCFDQIGFGRRIQEAACFAARYREGGEWSLLGKMARDAQAALDAMQALPYVDAQSITAVGYSLGALVGLHLAALDDRVAGLASVCGPAPFRLDTDLAETGGMWRWTGLHELAPRLAGCIGQEQDLPYDVDELLACLAPRPTLVLSPQLDREAPLDLVTRGVENARQNCLRYGIHPRLDQISPETYNQVGPEVQQIVLDWLGRPGMDK